MKLINEVKKVISRKFMEAITAGCAMVVFANGSGIKPEELAKLADFRRIDESLKVFELSDIIETCNNYAYDLESDLCIGKEKAFKAIDKIKKKSYEARRLLMACIAIGSAADELDEKENNVIREICCKLELDPLEFDLQSKYHPPTNSYRRTHIINDEPQREASYQNKENGIPEWMKDPSKSLKPPDKDGGTPEWMKNTSKITKSSDKDQKIPEWMKNNSE